MQFVAQTVIAENSGGLVQLAFQSSSGYLIVSRDMEASESEAAIGLDRVHIELNDQKNSTYGGLINAELKKDSFSITLNDRSSGNVGHTSILVTFHVSEEEYSSLFGVANLVFAKEQSFVSIA